MWSAEFVERISRSVVRPIFILETVEDVQFDPGVAPLKISSHNLPGYNQAIGLMGSRISAARVNIGDWTATVSELVIGYRGAVDIRRSVTRGQLLVLRVGFPGWGASDFEAVFYGQVQSVDRSGEDWTISMRSALSATASRMTTDEDDVALFGSLATTTLAEAYTVGEADIDVASTASAEVEDGAGKKYLIQIFPDSGDPFFLTASGVSGNTFTGCSAAGILGTTAANASNGNGVALCAHIYDRPTRVIRKVLQSTGTSVYGELDSLPANWGIGLPYWMFDDDDIGVTDLIVEPAGIGAKWNVYATEAVDDALSWLNGVASPAGMVICERQGLITIRAASPSYDRPYGVNTVNDSEIMSFDRCETWSTDPPLAWAYMIVQAAANVSGTGYGEKMDTRPASAERHVDLDYVEDDPDDWEYAVANRLGPWATRVAEVVEITCAGLRLAQLAPCDSLVVRSRHFTVRDRTPEPTLMVLSVEPDWWQGTVKLILAYIPESASEF